MPPRKKQQPAEPIRRSERLRLRKEAAEAAEAPKISEPGQQEPEQSMPLRRRKSRAPNGVATGGGATRRGRRSRQNLPVTSTPFNEPAAQHQMALFGRFIDGIFEAARESYAGEFMNNLIANNNQNEQPTEGQKDQVPGQELHAEDGPLAVELDIIVSMQSSDSEMDAI